MFFLAQRVLIALACTSAGIWIIDLAMSARSLWNVLWLGAPMALLAATMALEYGLLVYVSRQTGSVSPRLSALRKAWAGEVLASTRVFVWEQPFRSNRWADRLSSQDKDRTAVLMVHGFVCNRGIWNPWLKQLTRRRIPFAAISLQPVFGSIGDYETQIDTKVRELVAATGRSPVVVAHSMGGLAVRNWWARSAIQDPEGSAAARLACLLTLGSPHQGTWLARFGFSTNSRQMRMTSKWINDLSAIEPVEHRRRTVCFFSACDNVVFPREAGTLPDADNRELMAVAHVAMVNRPEPFEHLLALLEQLDGRPMLDEPRRWQ